MFYTLDLLFPCPPVTQMSRIFRLRIWLPLLSTLRRDQRNVLVVVGILNRGPGGSSFPYLPRFSSSEPTFTQIGHQSRVRGKGVWWVGLGTIFWSPGLVVWFWVNCLRWDVLTDSSRLNLILIVNICSLSFSTSTDVPRIRKSVFITVSLVRICWTTRPVSRFFLNLIENKGPLMNRREKCCRLVKWFEMILI